jgi:two-component system secretion response regulator SsrB
MRQYATTRIDYNNKPDIKQIVVVDNSPLTPFAIRKLLSARATMTVTGHAHDGASAISLCLKVKPELVIIDPNLQSIDGISVIKQIKRLTDANILVYTYETTSVSLDEFIKSGVNGIVLKNSSLKTLIYAIDAVSHNNKFLDPILTPGVSSPTPEKIIGAVKDLSLPHLTPREKQTLKLISEGEKNKQIARTLSISVKTVENHRLSLMRKLNAHSIVDLIRWAQRLNITQ